MEIQDKDNFKSSKLTNFRMSILYQLTYIYSSTFMFPSIYPSVLNEPKEQYNPKTFWH
jgi:hypothetical protein